MENWKHACRSSIIGTKSYPRQYPRSSTPLTPSPLLFLFSFPPFSFFLLALFCPLSFPFLLYTFFCLFVFLVSPLCFFCVCVSSYESVCVFGQSFPVWWQQEDPCVPANEIVKHEKIWISIIKVKFIRIHVYQYIERMFASNPPYRDKKPKYASKFWQKHGGDGKRWPLTSSPFPCRGPPVIETSPRPVPPGPLIYPRTPHVLKSHSEHERAVTLSALML